MSTDLESLHKLCGWHEDVVRRSNRCGCFHCLEFFSPREIVDWIEEPADCPRGAGKTAVCPRCGIDAVLPDTTGDELTGSLLSQMQHRWFR